jgi:hypothetical protein
MKALRLFFLFLFFVLVMSVLNAQESAIEQQLDNIPGLVSVQKIEHHPFFQEAYEVIIEQYLDHDNRGAGTFNQRLVLSVYNKFSPVVFVTEGYRANYAVKPYLNELSRIIQANQLVVEHRYFGKSKPETTQWDYLSIEQSVADLHRVHNMFKEIFNNQNKWIATGISKGGQHTIAYKAFYPNDMDGWVSYVGPVNFAVEDKRMQKFIKKAGSEECREKIERFQLEVLQNRDEIQPLLDSLIGEMNYTFSISDDEVLDYCVLEYPFSFCQWGHSCSSIPEFEGDLNEMFSHLIKVSSPSYFALEEIEKIKPFFIQAVKEFGYYGYDTKPLRKQLIIDNAKNYIPRVFLADEPVFKYSKSTSKLINKTIQSGGENLILIYGENDPWTAAGISPGRKSQASIFIMPEGSHRTRIDSMSYEMQGEIYKLLEKFLGID